MEKFISVLRQNHSWDTTFLLVSTLTVTFFAAAVLLRREKPNSPPSPPRLPLVGNLHQLGSLPHRPLQRLAAKYGPLMLLHLGSVPTIVISSAELAREALKTHDLAVASRPASSVADRLFYHSVDVAFAPYGEYWRQVRRVAVLHLLSVKRVQSLASVREEEVSLLVEKIRSSSTSSLVNLSEMILALTFDVICRSSLGRKYSTGEEEGKRFHDAILEMAALLGSIPVKDFIPWLGWIDRLSGLEARVRRNRSELDGLMEEVVEQHLHALRSSNGDHKVPNNFMDVLLSLDHNDESVGISLGRDQIKALSLEAFVGGTETSFTTLEWTMAELIKNPDVMKKAQQEIREVIGSKGKITEEDLERMKYMKAVIQESLRLHPPLPLLVARETVADIKLQGYGIPAGTRIMINAWAIGRDSNSWDSPKEFRPERFIDSDIDFKGQDFRSIPFGAGRRACPGVGFAIAVVKLTLANLLHHFDWELPNNMQGKELDMNESPGIAVHLKSSLILVAKPRLS